MALEFLTRFKYRLEYGPLAEHVFRKLRTSWRRLIFIFVFFMTSFSSIFFFENQIKKSVGSYLIPTATLRMDNPKAEVLLNLLPFDWSKIKKNYYYKRHFLNNIDLAFITQQLNKIDAIIHKASSFKKLENNSKNANITEVFLEVNKNQDLLPMSKWSPQESETWHYLFKRLSYDDLRRFVLSYIKINEHIHNSLKQIPGSSNLANLLWLIENRKKLLTPSLIQIQKENNWITNNLPRAYYSNELTNIEMYQRIFEKNINTKRGILKRVFFVIMLSLQFTLFTFIFSLRRKFSNETSGTYQ